MKKKKIEIKTKYTFKLYTSSGKTNIVKNELIQEIEKRFKIEMKNYYIIKYDVINPFYNIIRVMIFTRKEDKGFEHKKVFEAICDENIPYTEKMNRLKRHAPEMHKHYKEQNKYRCFDVELTVCDNPYKWFPATDDDIYHQLRKQLLESKKRKSTQ